MASKDDKDSKQADDDFETVNHEDAQNPSEGNVGKPASGPPDLELQRYGNNLQDVGDEDDSDDDEHAMAQHPLFGMLAGRLGQRRRGSTHKYDKLHPENQVLTIANVNECVEVESAFPDQERCSKDKVSQLEHNFLNLSHCV